MAYAKKWIPPTVPYRDNLPAWKELFTDLHDNLLAAGLVQTDAEEQLDFDTVTALPIDNAYAGFREYAFSDALQAEAPVLLRLYFGCGNEGFSNGTNAYVRTRTPRIRANILFCGKSVWNIYCPQGFNYSSATGTGQLNNKGFSAISYAPEYGFFGIAYGAGSRNKPFMSNIGSYYGATLTCFIQRTVDALGQPTPEGVMCYGPSLTSGQAVTDLWASAKLQQAVSIWGPCGGQPVGSTTMAPRVGRQEFASGGESLLLEPIYAPSSPPRAFPYIYSYYHTTIGETSEFAFSPLIGPPKNFIALGRETSISVDAEDAQNAGIAMLFQND